MDFEPDRFAFSYARAFCFASSGNAYDATQTDAAISRGAILLIASERIVGLADTWPIAVTQAHGALHQIAPGRFADLGALVAEFGISESDFLEAAQLARELGFALDPTLEALLGSLL
ncbi:MAG: hypothetical protein IPN84_16785 [Sphingomonadales bacterium]|nr:hypothetical protein [Sphingomonadales bacterium]